MAAPEIIKVVLVTPSISRIGGGVAEAVRLTAAALRNDPRVAVEIAALVDDASDEALAAFGDLPVHLTNVWAPRRLGFSPGLLIVLLQVRPHVVHVHGLWQAHTAIVLLWALLTGRPYVVTPHGMLEAYILARSRRLKAVFGFLFQNFFLRRAAAFQALTEKEVDDIQAICPDACCNVIANYVPLQETPHSYPYPEWLNDSLVGRTIFLFFGRIHDKKGVVELLYAWNRACSDDGSFRTTTALVFCGWIDCSPDFLPTLEMMAAQWGNVFYVGPQYNQNRSRSLAAADFFVLPSYSEGLPMSVLEAWSFGKPVLMTAACNLQIGFEVGAARKIDVEEVQLAEQLCAASAMTEHERHLMADAARTLVLERYSSVGIASELIKFYYSVIAKNLASNRHSITFGSK